MNKLTALRMAFIIGAQISQFSVFALDKKGHESPNVEALAPAKCGVLIPCDRGGNKIFLLSCEGKNVMVKRCKSPSIFPIDDVNKCVGPERRILKDDFLALTKGVVNSPDFAGASNISQADIRTAKSHYKLKDEKKCAEDLEERISSLNGKLKQLDGYLSSAAEQEISSDIRLLESRLGVVNSNIDLCNDKEAAIKKIMAKINGALDDICTKSIHIPKEGTLLHTVLAKMDPTRLPCNSELSCSEKKMTRSAKFVVPVVARNYGEFGQIEEYVKDPAPEGRIWGPLSSTQLSYEAALKYCEDLNKKNPPPANKTSWRLPDKEDFLKAFNPSNLGPENEAFEDLFSIGHVYEFHWTKSRQIFQDRTGAPFQSLESILKSKGNKARARCVAT